jgi:hypothetical protein
MNNLAIKHMERGEHAKAIKTLTMAFFAFRKVYRHMKSCPSQAGFSSSSSSSSIVSAEAVSDTASHSSSSLEASSTTRINADSFFYRSSRTSWNTRPRRSDSAASSLKEALLQPSQDCGCVSHCRETAASTINNDDDNDDDENEDDLQEVSVYSNPMHIPADFAMEPESTSGFISTAVTFNLALANHLQGMDLFWQQKQQQQQQQQRSPQASKNNNKEAQKYFVSAGKLYEYTLRLERARSLSHVVNKTSSNTSLLIRSGPMILMSVLNNLGQLHLQQLDNVPQSKKCFAHLQSLLLCWMQFTASSQRSVSASSSSSSNAEETHHHQQQQQHELIQCFMENSLVGLEQLKCNTALAA